MSAKLHFLGGALRGEAIPLPERELKIGRDPGMDLVIPAEEQRFVSRLHAVIYAEGGRYIVEDRESTNGTWVNRSRIRRAVLTDGDEIQFGRKGPVARFRSGAADAETVLAGTGWTVGGEPVAPAATPRWQPPGPAKPPPAPAPRPADGERPSQMVRRLVSEALAVSTRRSRGRVALFALGAVLALGAAIGATFRFGLWEDTEQTFRRLAESYEERVVLVETGILYEGTYYKRGNGTGFVAGEEGLIVTNKHVVQPHLYSQNLACEAESFRRRRLSYEEALVITVWPGGSRFRQTPTTPVGDRGLGYSTEHGTLRLAVVAPDNLIRARTIRCSDVFTGRGFTMDWREHADDNNDLAVLRASAPLPALPLASREPRPDDPVLVYGFPRGVLPLETNDAHPIRRMGRVLRVQETIQIDAAVLVGNSGGPLIDADGNVVGITTRGAAETLNMAIKVEYARRLLDRTRQAPLP